MDNSNKPFKEIDSWTATPYQRLPEALKQEISAYPCCNCEKPFDECLAKNKRFMWVVCNEDSETNKRTRFWHFNYKVSRQYKKYETLTNTSLR